MKAEVDVITNVNLDESNYKASSHNTVLRVFDPNHNGILQAFNLGDKKLDPELLDRYGIHIWESSDTIAIHSTSGLKLEIGGTFAAKNLIVCAEGAVKFNPEVKASSSLLVKASEVEFTNKISTRELLIDSPVVKGININVDNKSKAEILNAKVCQFEGLTVAGRLSLNDSNVGCNQIFLTGEEPVNVDNCELTIKHSIDGNAKTPLSISSSNISAKTISIKGTATIEDVLLHADDLNIEGVTQIFNSDLKLKTSMLLTEDSNATLDNCEVETPSYYGNGQVSIAGTTINTEFYQQNASAEYVDSTILAVDIVDVNAKQAANNTKFIVQGEFVASDDMALENQSSIVAKSVLHQSGKLSVKDSSIKAEQHILIQKQSDSLLDKGFIEAELLSMSGTACVVNSEMHANIAQIFAQLNVHNTSVEVKKFFLSAIANLKATDHSNFKAEDVVLNGSAQFKEKSSVTTDAIDVGFKAVLDLQGDSSAVTNELKIAGVVEVVDSKLASLETTLHGEMALQKATTSVGKLEVEYGATLVAQESSKIVAANADIDGNLLLDDSQLITKENLLLNISANVVAADSIIGAQQNLEQRSNLQAHDATLYAKNEFNSTKSASTTGSSLLIKAKSANLGGVTKLTENLNLQAETASVVNDISAKTAVLQVENGLDINAKVESSQIKIDTNYLNLRVGGILKGENLSATTLTTTLLPGSQINVSNAYIEALSYNNFGGAVFAYNSNINAMVGVDAGLNLPTLPTDKSQLLNPDKLWSVGGTLLSNVSRPLGTAFSMCNKSVGLYRASKGLYESYQNSPEMKDKRLRHYLSPMLKAKGLLVSANSLYNETGSLYKHGCDFSAAYSEGRAVESMWHDQNSLWSASENFVADAASLLAPSVTREIGFSANTGLTASYTVNDQNISGVYAGFTGGHNVRVQSLYNQYNFGTFNANTLNLEAKRHYNSGSESAKHFIFTAKEAQVAEGGVMHASQRIDGNVSGNFEVAGTADFSGGKFKAGATNVATSGDVHIRGAHYKTDVMRNSGKTEVVNRGTLDAKKTMVAGGNTAVAADSKHLVSEISVAKAAEYANAGLLAAGLVLGLDDEPDQFIAVDHIAVDEGGTFDISGTAKVKSCLNEGESNFIQANVEFESYTQASTGVTNIDQAIDFSAQHSNLAGRTNIENNSTVDLGVAQIADGANVNVAQSKVFAEQVNVAGCFNVQDESLAVIKDMNIATTGTYQLQQSSHVGDNLVNDGKIVATDANVELTNIFANNGEVQYSKNLQVTSDNFNSSAESEFVGADGSHSTVIAKNANVLGHEDHDSTAQIISNMSGEKAATLFTGVDGRVNVRSAIHVETETTDDLLLTQHARGRQVASSLKTNGNVDNLAEFHGRSLDVESGGRIDMHANATTTENLCLAAKDNLNNHGATLRSTEASVFMSSERTVDNHGGSIQSAKLTYVTAKENVLNRAKHVHKTLGDQQYYDYQIATMSGGVGSESSDGVGLYVHADGRVKGEAAKFEAQGAAVLDGDEGVSVATVSTKRGYDYRLDDKNGKTYHRGDTSILGESSVTGEKIIFSSKNGGIDIHGTKSIADKGVQAIAKKEVNLTSHVTTDYHYEKRVRHKVSSRKKEEWTPAEKVNVIATNSEKIQVKSEEESINALGTVFLLGKNATAEFSAKKGVNIERRKLQHHVHTKTKSISVKIAGQKVGKQSAQERLSAANPIKPLEKLGNTTNPLEIINGLNALNDISNLASKLAAQGLTSTLLQGLDASVGRTIAETAQTFEFQGASGIYGGAGATIDTPEDVRIGGDIVTKRLEMDAARLTLQNQQLNYSSSTQQTSVSASVNAQGVVGGSAQLSESEARGFTNTQGRIDTDELVLKVKNVEVNGFIVRTKELDLQGVESITTRDTLNQHNGSSASFGVDSNGGVSLSNGTQSAQIVDAYGGIFADTLTPNSTVKELHNVGTKGFVIADQTAMQKVVAEAVCTQEDLHEHRSSKTISFSANMKQLESLSTNGFSSTIGVNRQKYSATVGENGRTNVKESKLDVDFRTHMPAEMFQPNSAKDTKSEQVAPKEVEKTANDPQDRKNEQEPAKSAAAKSNTPAKMKSQTQSQAAKKSVSSKKPSQSKTTSTAKRTETSKKSVAKDTDYIDDSQETDFYDRKFDSSKELKMLAGVAVGICKDKAESKINKYVQLNRLLGHLEQLDDCYPDRITDRTELSCEQYHQDNENFRLASKKLDKDIKEVRSHPVKSVVIKLIEAGEEIMDIVQESQTAPFAAGVKMGESFNHNVEFAKEFIVPLNNPEKLINTDKLIALGEDLIDRVDANIAKRSSQNSPSF